MRVQYEGIYKSGHFTMHYGRRTIQQDPKHHHLTLPEAADLAQNRPLWRMMSTYGATQP